MEFRDKVKKVLEEIDLPDLEVEIESRNSAGLWPRFSRQRWKQWRSLIANISSGRNCSIGLTTTSKLGSSSFTPPLHLSEKPRRNPEAQGRSDNVHR